MKSVCIFAGSSLGIKESYKDLAISLGQALVKNNFSMVYGGGSKGLMGVIADSVIESGGEVRGVITQQLKEIIVDNQAKTQIEIDGGVNSKNAKKLVDAGADVLVAGSFVFKSQDPKQTVKELKQIANS